MHLKTNKWKFKNCKRLTQQLVLDENFNCNNVWAGRLNPYSDNSSRKLKNLSTRIMDQNQGQNADQGQPGHPLYLFFILGSIQRMIEEHNGPLQAKFNLLQAYLEILQPILALDEQLREHPPIGHNVGIMWYNALLVAGLMDHLRDYRDRAGVSMEEYNHYENDIAQRFPVFVQAIELLETGALIARLHWVKLLSALFIDDLETAKKEREWMRDHHINIPNFFIGMFPPPFNVPLTFDLMVQILEERLNHKQYLINYAAANHMPQPFEQLETLLNKTQIRRFLALRPWQRQQPPLQPLGEHPQPPNAAEQFAHDFIRQAMTIARAYYRLRIYAEYTTLFGDLVNDPSYTSQVVTQLVRLRDQFSNMNPVISALHGPRPAIPNSQAAARVRHFQLLLSQFNALYDLLRRARTIYRLSFIRYYFAVQMENQYHTQLELQWLQGLAIQLPTNNDQLLQDLIQASTNAGQELQIPDEVQAGQLAPAEENEEELGDPENMDEGNDSESSMSNDDEGQDTDWDEDEDDLNDMDIN